MKKNVHRIVMLLIAVFLFSGMAVDVARGDALVYPVEGKNGMVVTGQELATRAGLEVLRNGGNAVDAAVSIGFVMAVTLPSAGNIGGGGFMLVHSAKTGEVVAIDYREKAPAKSFRDMYLDKDGNVDSSLSRFSHLAAGVPGTVAGFAMALETHGTISLEQALAPAIEYADKGFILNEKSARYIQSKKKRLTRFPSTKKIFFKPDGGFYEAGERFVQKDLAKTLKAIAAEGPKAFYEGEIADLIVKQMAANNGFITREDLAN